MWRRSLLSLVGYFALFGWFGLDWLKAASHAAPGVVNPPDTRLVVWILGWVAHALGTSPSHLFDANINYPAPLQLTAIEHLLSAQLIFAPIFWLTGNATLGANLVAFSTYPLGAWAMERLLLALGCGGGAAWAGGLYFALNAMRVPANLLLVKYANVYLALVALALTRLRERPERYRATALALALAAGVFSSYYMAVMVAVVASVWGAIELLRSLPDRWRFAALASVAAVVALGLLVSISLPYFNRPEAGGVAGDQPSLLNAAVTVIELTKTGWLPLALAMLGAMAIGSRFAGARTAAWRGLAITAVGQLFVQSQFSGWHIPLAAGSMTISPLVFFRYPFRFVVVMSFGLSLLVAAAFDVIERRLGRVAGAIAVVAIAALTLAKSLDGLVAGVGELTGQSHPIYAAVDETARRQGRGPLLELPATNRIAEVEAMVGSTRHWLPLLTGYTDYPPAHRAPVMQAIASLPRDDALDDLVSMTRVRWILLEPEDVWPAAQRWVRAGMLRLPGVNHALSLEGWDLLRLDHVAHHPQWFATIAAGRRPGATVLGTPLAPLEPTRLRSLVMLRQPLGALSAESLLVAPLTITNLGQDAWPAAVGSIEPERFTVELVGGWRAADEEAQGETVGQVEQRLWRDLPPREQLRQELWMGTPAAPGIYDLSISLRQIDGADFTGEGNTPLLARITVIPRERH
jgi:hypothetical protein